MNQKNEDTDQTPRQSREIDVGVKAETTTSEWGPPPSVSRLSRDERIAAERKLKRKIDFRLLPIIVVMYILSNSPSLFGVLLIIDYLDRNAIASTRLGGITQDLGLVGNQFQTSVSILFVGCTLFHFCVNCKRYILMQVPSNLFLDRIGKPAIYLPCWQVFLSNLLTLAQYDHLGNNFGMHRSCKKLSWSPYLPFLPRFH